MRCDKKNIEVADLDKYICITWLLGESLFSLSPEVSSALINGMINSTLLYRYSQTPEIETVNLSQYYVGFSFPSFELMAYFIKTQAQLSKIIERCV